MFVGVIATWLSNLFRVVPEGPSRVSAIANGVTRYGTLHMKVENCHTSSLQ